MTKEEFHEEDVNRGDDGRFAKIDAAARKSDEDEEKPEEFPIDPLKAKFRQNTPYSVIMAYERRRMAEEERRTRKISQPVVKRGEELAKIRELTGVNEATAKKYQATVFEWSTDSSKIRNGEDPEGERILEDYIARSSKYDGKVYRGIHFPEKDGRDYLEGLEEKKQRLSSLDMGGVSSWSSYESIARDFSTMNMFLDTSIGIIFETENVLGAPVDYLSRHGKTFSQNEEEGEVLHSKNTEYIIKDIVRDPKESLINGYYGSKKQERYRVILEEIK